jgi:hypothetical protein
VQAIEGPSVNFHVRIHSLDKEGQMDLMGDSKSGSNQQTFDHNAGNPLSQDYNLRDES